MVLCSIKLAKDALDNIYPGFFQYLSQQPTEVRSSPVHIAQLDRALDLKTRGCGFDSLVGQLNKY